jgi:hypothetical protein
MTPSPNRAEAALWSLAAVVLCVIGALARAADASNGFTPSGAWFGRAGVIAWVASVYGVLAAVLAVASVVISGTSGRSPWSTLRETVRSLPGC